MRKRIVNANLNNLNVKNYKVKVTTKKKNNAFQFIIGVLSYALFSWLLLVGIILLLYVGNNKLKAMKGDTSVPTYNAFVVLSGSMEPNIKVNDAIVTKKTEMSALEEGDVITFLSSDSRFYGVTVTHRIVEKYYDATKNVYTFKTKGDNNNTNDLALVQQDNILGRVIFRLPKLGYIQTFLASKGGWIIVILIPCLAIIAYDIAKIIKMLDKKTKVIKK